MTEEQKVQIAELHKAGIGYIKIGQRLGISNNTVRSFCRRAGLTNSAEVPFIACKQCGKPIRLVHGHKQRKFCSDRCRQKWWNSHIDEVERKAIYQFTCQYCGKLFSAYGNKNRKYCSRACYIADRYGKPCDCHGC